jgi:hypothetical protein
VPTQAGRSLARKWRRCGFWRPLPMSGWQRRLPERKLILEWSGLQPGGAPRRLRFRGRRRIARAQTPRRPPPHLRVRASRCVSLKRRSAAIAHPQRSGSLPSMIVGERMLRGPPVVLPSRIRVVVGIGRPCPSKRRPRRSTRGLRPQCRPVPTMHRRPSQPSLRRMPQAPPQWSATRGNNARGRGANRDSRLLKKPRPGESRPGRYA